MSTGLRRKAMSIAARGAAIAAVVGWLALPRPVQPCCLAGATAAPVSKSASAPACCLAKTDKNERDEDCPAKDGGCPGDAPCDSSKCPCVNCPSPCCAKTIPATERAFSILSLSRGGLVSAALNAMPELPSIADIFHPPRI